MCTDLEHRRYHIKARLTMYLCVRGNQQSPAGLGISLWHRGEPHVESDVRFDWHDH